VVGTYWNCYYDSNEIERCDLTIEICDDEGPCFRVPATADCGDKFGTPCNFKAVPKDETARLIVGTKWDCYYDEVLEEPWCDLKLVVCEEDGPCYDVP
jgi:hypothetical protein